MVGGPTVMSISPRSSAARRRVTLTLSCAPRPSCGMSISRRIAVMAAEDPPMPSCRTLEPTRDSAKHHPETERQPCFSQQRATTNHTCRIACPKAVSTSQRQAGLNTTVFLNHLQNKRIVGMPWAQGVGEFQAQLVESRQREQCAIHAIHVSAGIA